MISTTNNHPARLTQPKNPSNGTTGISDDSISTGNNDQTVYAVLYYKRKNKVHKSKGVSKMDGILTVTAPPKSLVSLSTSTGTTVVAARRECEIAAQELEDDSILNLGSYEVEIMYKQHAFKSKGHKPIPPPPSFSTSTATARISSSAKNTTTNPIRRRVELEHIQDTKTNIPSLPVPTNAPLKTVHRKALPKMPSAARKQSCLPENASAKSTPPTASSTTSLPSVAAKNQCAKPFASSTSSTLKRSLLQTSTPLGAPQSRAKRLNMPLHKRREAKLPSTSEEDLVPSTSNAESSFPGAVGTIDLPHAIASVLKPHQRSGLVFLWNCLTGSAKPSPGVFSMNEDRSSTTMSTYKGGCILADEMGLGKTLMTIATICALYRQKRDKKYIVVCPSSLVSNWAKEFDKWLGNACQPKRIVVDKGGQESVQQIRVFCQSGMTHNAPQVLIVSYDIFRRNVDIFQAMPTTLTRLLVVDEGHRLKNTAKSLTLTALESLPCQSRLLLTATPIQNVMSDFYTIADFCCPGVLGDLSTFRREFERPISTANNKDCTLQQRQKGAQQSRILDEITKTFMLRRLQKDVLKTMLPPRQEVMLFCRPSALQCSLYQELTLLQRKGIDGGGATTDALQTLTSLRKLCLHPSLLTSEANGTPPQHPKIADSGKVSVLEQLLVKMKSFAPHDKVVIVSNFTSALNLIERSILKPRGLTYVRLDGSTELSSRHSIVDTFNKTSSERTFAFLLSSKAGGCGLNLIGANRLIMFDPDWNPASDVQAMARIWRQGQQKPCTIYRLFTSGTVEEVICQRQIQKGNLSSRAVDCMKSSASLGFSKEELRDCFTLKEDCACDTKEKAGDSWLPYDGPESIISLGCDDHPLLHVASHAPQLAFVHLVTDAPQEVCSEASEEDNSSTSMTSEEEWHDSSPFRVADHSDEDNSSDEENEFE